MNCNTIYTYTFWYNIVLYYLLLQNSKDSIMYSYLLFSIPVFIIGEYIMWGNKYYKKCKYSLSKAVINSFVSHWIPLILLYVYYNKNTYIDKTTLFYVLCSMILYIVFFQSSIIDIYKLSL